MLFVNCYHHAKSEFKTSLMHEKNCVKKYIEPNGIVYEVNLTKK
jgi:hypothetical protein